MKIVQEFEDALEEMRDHGITRGTLRNKYHMTEYGAVKFTDLVADREEELDGRGKKKFYTDKEPFNHSQEILNETIPTENNHSKELRITQNQKQKLTNRARNFLEQLEKEVKEAETQPIEWSEDVETSEEGIDLIWHETDAHFGALSENEYGEIIYDSDVATDRLHTRLKRFEKLATTKCLEQDKEIDTIHFLLGGDWMEGTAIYHGQGHEVDMTGLQYGDSGSSLDYGLSISNCQNLDLHGFFSSRRHGIAHGGGSGVGSVPNRGVKTGGYVSMHGDTTTVLAFDFHGNTEHCSFDGIVKGGVNVGGDYNKVSGTVHAGKNGLLVYAGEWSGCHFDFSGVSFIGSNDVSASGRGVFDVGGSSNAINENTYRGGTIDLSKTRWEIPNVSQFGFYLRNRGASVSEPIIIDLSDAHFTSTSSSLQDLIRVNNISGDNVSLLKLDGLWSDRSHNIVANTTDRVKGPTETGRNDQVSDDSVNSITESVTFDREFPDPPSVTLSIERHTTGSDRLIGYARNVTSSGFLLDVRTAGGENFSSSGQDIGVTWQAESVN